MYGDSVFQDRVGDIITEFVMSVIRKFPSLLSTLKTCVTSYLQASAAKNPVRERLLLRLCHIVGECLNPAVYPAFVPSVVAEYYEVFELIVYERMGVIRMEENSRFVVPRFCEHVSIIIR